MSIRPRAKSRLLLQFLMFAVPERFAPLITAHLRVVLCAVPTTGDGNFYRGTTSNVRDDECASEVRPSRHGGYNRCIRRRGARDSCRLCTPRLGRRTLWGRVWRPATTPNRLELIHHVL